MRQSLVVSSPVESMMHGCRNTATSPPTTRGCRTALSHVWWVKSSFLPEISETVDLGFPFYVKKLFTRNIVTDVTDGYYVVITVVTTYKNMRNYITKLRYGITLRNYVAKLRYEIITWNKKFYQNYVTLWRIRNQEVKIGGLYCGKYSLMVVSAVLFNLNYV